MVNKIIVDGRVVTIDISSDDDNWLVIKDEKYRPDRAQFVLDAFREKFKDISIDSAESVYKLASRSTLVNSWLAGVNLKYAQIQNEPTFYRDYIDPDTYDIIAADLLKQTRNNQERAKAEFSAAQDYADKLKAIARKFEIPKVSNKFSKIVSLQSNALPITFQLAIENYTPSASAKEPGIVKKAYAREVLINYKLQLIDMVKKDPSLDIDQFIMDAQEK